MSRGDTKDLFRRCIKVLVFSLKLPKVHANRKVELAVVALVHNACVGIVTEPGCMWIQAVETKTIVESQHTEHREEDANTHTG